MRRLWWMVALLGIMAAGCGDELDPKRLVVGDGSRSDFYANAIYLRKPGKRPVLWPSLSFNVRTDDDGTRQRKGRVTPLRRIDIKFNALFRGSSVRVGGETVDVEGSNYVVSLFKQDWEALSAKVGVGGGGLPLDVELTLPNGHEASYELTLPVKSAAFLAHILDAGGRGIPMNRGAKGWVMVEPKGTPSEARRAKRDKRTPKLRYRFGANTKTLGDIRYVAKRTDIDFVRFRCHGGSKKVQTFTSKIVILDRKTNKKVAQRLSKTVTGKPCPKPYTCPGPDPCVVGKGKFVDDLFDSDADAAWVKKRMSTLRG